MAGRPHDDEARGVVVPMRLRPDSPRPRTPRSPEDEAEVFAFTGSEAVAPAIVAPPPLPIGWEARAADVVGFLRRRMSGTYPVDEYGFDSDLTESLALPLFRAMYERWFRVEVNGLEHVPSDGGALLVANHAGGLLAWDAAMAAVAVRLHHPAHRYLRLLGAEQVFRTPGLGTLARRTGATLACAPDAERLLRSGELVGAFPEGYRGLGKRYRDRYQVQRFGHRAFVPAAIVTGTPIVPVSIVGSEEISPVVGRVPVLARLLNVPYFPITPTFPLLGPLGLVPLPSKWYVEFGEPIPTDSTDPADPDAVDELVDRLHESIQAALYRLLVQRRSAWR